MLTLLGVDVGHICNGELYGRKQCLEEALKEETSWYNKAIEKTKRDLEPYKQGMFKKDIKEHFYYSLKHYQDRLGFCVGSGGHRSVVYSHAINNLKVVLCSTAHKPFET